MPTLSLTKTAISGRVPNEFVGLARQLRYRVGENAIAARRDMEELIVPFQPRPGFKPMPSHKLLQNLRDRWKGLPEVGRLDMTAEFENGKLVLSEIRAVASRLRYKGWNEDDWEECIN